MQIKPQVITSYKSEWPSPKGLQLINVGEHVEKREHFYTVGGSINWCIHYGDQYWVSFKKQKIKLPYDPATPFLGIYMENMKTLIQKDTLLGASLVVQWLRICLPMQETQVRALVWEVPTCCGTTKPVHHNYWACALEPVNHNYQAHVSQLLKPTCLESMLHNKRSHHNEKPALQQSVGPAYPN